MEEGVYSSEEAWVEGAVVALRSGAVVASCVAVGLEGDQGVVRCASAAHASSQGVDAWAVEVAEASPVWARNRAGACRRVVGGAEEAGKGVRAVEEAVGQGVEKALVVY